MQKFWKDKKIFITGGTGFIGSWLTKKLVDCGANVSVLVCDSITPQELIRSGYFEKINVVSGRLEDYAILENTLSKYKVDTVFHLGAQTQVQEAVLHPLPTYESNIRGTYSLLEACRVHGHLIERVIVASSDKAYGIHTELPYVESTPLRAIYPYDVSKACTDLIALSYYHTYQLPIVVTRCGNVYGGGDFNEQRLIPSLIKSFYQNERPLLRSNGHSLRDYIFIEDIIQAYLALAEQLQSKALQGEVFNFSTNQPVKVLQIVSMLAKLMDKEHIQPIIENNAHSEIPHQYLNAEKSWKKLGWKPYIPLKLGLSMTLDWYTQFFEMEQAIEQQMLFNHSLQQIIK